MLPKVELITSGSAELWRHVESARFVLGVTANLSERGDKAGAGSRLCGLGSCRLRELKVYWEEVIEEIGPMELSLVVDTRQW